MSPWHSQGPIPSPSDHYTYSRFGELRWLPHSRRKAGHDTMTDLILRRGHGYRDMFRAYRIFVDGRKVGTIRDNSQVRIPVSAGKHTVQLKIDWCVSQELVVSVAPRLSTVLQCGPNDKENLWKTISFNSIESSYYIRLDVLTKVMQKHRAGQIVKRRVEKATKVRSRTLVRGVTAPIRRKAKSEREGPRQGRRPYRGTRY
jgi:hypothetical protein